MAALDLTTVHQGGDDGLKVLFPVEKFAAVAKIMRRRRRRQVSEAERERLAEMSEKFSPLRISGARQNERQGAIGSLPRWARRPSRGEGRFCPPRHMDGDAGTRELPAIMAA